MKNLLILFLMFAVLTGCNKEELIHEDSQLTDELSSETRAPETDALRFRTFDELDRFIREKNESDADLLELSRVEAERGRKSLLYLYSLNLAELDDLRLSPRDLAVVNSHDDMLHYLLNKNGEIIIGNETIRVGRDFVYRYPENSSSLVDEFLGDYNNGRTQISDLESLELPSGLTVYKHGNYNEMLDEEFAGRTTTFTDYFSGNQYRMKSKQFDSNWVFYSSIGASTRVQKRKRFWFFGWHYYWSTVSKYNRLNYQGEYSVNPSVGPDFTESFDGNRYCYCSCASKTYSWSVGFPAAPYQYTPISGSGETVHWAHEFSVSPNTEHRTINY